MPQSFFLNSSSIGVDLNNFSATALFAVGTHVLGNNGTEWVYVQANTSILGNTVVAFNSGTYTAGMASAGDTTLGGQLGIAQTSCSSQAFFWVALRGIGLSVQVGGTTTASSQWYVGGSGGANGTTGTLTSNITASGTVVGVAFTGSTVSATGATSGQALGVFNISWPRWNAPFG